ncbi:MAG: type VI secretion system membrane subunit TssM [Pseudomonadales bacterium]
MWNSIKKFGKFLAPYFKAAAPVLLALVVILLLVAIWWFGPRLELFERKPLESVAMRAIASLVIVLTIALFWGIRQYRKLKAIRAAEAQAQRYKDSPVQQIIDKQEAEFDQILEGMREGLGGGNYLYKLPWYLVMGVENAGKTSLINRSEQSFALTAALKANMGKRSNPYGVDWWIGDESVIMDPDGEILTQGSVNPENGEVKTALWNHFIEWLERNRSRRPLNGAIIVLDLEKLSTGSVSDRKAYASVIRTRLRELMERLSTRFPIYVVLSKMDLLSGFDLFFKHMSKAEREQAMGFTFSMDSVHSEDGWLKEFDAQYTQMLERMNALLPKQLEQSKNTQERTALYSFVRQLSGLKEVLQHFLKEALESDRFSTSALVRGVYYTSVYQQGVPSDVFINNAAKRYNLPEQINRAQHAAQSSIFFSGGLFRNIIYPESGIAGDNFKVARQKRNVLILATLACSIASVMIVLTWRNYYDQNSVAAEGVLAKAADYIDQNIDYKIDPSGRNLIEPLNLIREATLEFGFYRERTSILADSGLYQGRIIGPQVEKAYLELLASRYLPALMQGIVQDMKTKAPGSNEKLTVLRVLRMMEDSAGRTGESVQQYMARRWQQEFNAQGEVQNELMGHLNYAMEHTDIAQSRREGEQKVIRAVHPFDNEIKQAQIDLARLPLEQRIYRNMTHQAAAELSAPLDLKTVIGPVYDIVFKDRSVQGEALANETNPIERLYTKDGLTNYFLPRTDGVTNLAIIDSWVLGKTQKVDFSEADKRYFREQLADQYVADYSSAWRRAINKVEVQNFADINHAVLILRNMTDSNQPLQRLINAVKTNTALFPKLENDSDEARELALKTPQYALASRIDKQFSELTNLNQSSGDQQAYIEEVMMEITNLYNYMKAIQDAPDVGKAALEAAKKRLTLNDIDPIFSLQRMAAGLPKPMDALVGKLAEQSWNTVLRRAVKQVEKRWYEDIYLEFEEKIAGRYPFAAGSRRDVSLQDFERFFAPDGKMSNFYRENMKIFLEDNLEELNSIGAEGEQLIRQDVLDQLAAAWRIQEAFFDRKGNLSVQFSVQPTRLSGNKRRSVINIDGQIIDFSHGASREISMVWPNSLREGNRSKLTLVPLARNYSPRSIERTGPWAFFRLIEAGQLSGSSASDVTLSFNIDQGNVSYKLLAESNNNPFTQSLFKAFSLPKNLY